MFERSILKHSGQMWKLWLCALLLAISGVGMAASKALIESMSSGLFAVVMMGSACDCSSSVTRMTPARASRFVRGAVLPGEPANTPLRSGGDRRGRLDSSCDAGTTNEAWA